MNDYKMQITYLLVLLAIVVQQYIASDIFDYLHKCKVSDPKFDDCVLTSANTYVSTIFNGNEKYNIPRPNLTDLSRTYKITDKFHLHFTNLTTNYFENLVVTSIHFDFDKKLLTFSTTSADVDWISDYEAVGEILGKAAHETGKMNMTFGSVENLATVTLDFKTDSDRKVLIADSCKLVVNIKDFKIKPYDQQTVGEPMTAEQKQEYQSYLDKMAETIKKHNEKDDKMILGALNGVFMSFPFEELFIP